MTILDDVRDLIARITPNAICDDCIASELKITPRQHANHKSRELSKFSTYLREQNNCSVCNKNKLVIRTRRPSNQEIDLTVNGNIRQIFGTRFWGFNPESEPFCAFTNEGSRDKLIKIGKPGALILVLGTKTENTAVEDQGRLLGLIEFEKNAFDSTDLLSNETAQQTELFKNGNFKWPHALPALRAWRFEDKPKVESIIGRQFTMAAITDVDTLSEEEIRKVLACDLYEITLPETRAIRRRATLKNTKLAATGDDRVGPPPSEWSKFVSHIDGPTTTYLAQFGTYDVWKFGISKDAKNRLRNLNFSIPVEITKARWELRKFHNHDSGQDAYEMEQALVAQLKMYSTGNERVQCSQKVVDNAWLSYISKLF